jgi:hypothetical protein
MNEREQFEAWANAKFGAWPNSATPQTERFASYWECWQAALAASPVPAQQNQCDGCMAGMPLERGFHRDKGGHPVQLCERSRYETAPAPSVEAQAGMSNAARDVSAERRRQIEVEGWTPEHDDKHSDGELAEAAAAYAIASAEGKESLPRASKQFLQTCWTKNWWKPKDRRSNLVRAGALILAEIERLDRATLKEHSNG